MVLTTGIIFAIVAFLIMTGVVTGEYLACKDNWQGMCGALTGMISVAYSLGVLLLIAIPFGIFMEVLKTLTFGVLNIPSGVGFLLMSPVIIGTVVIVQYFLGFFVSKGFSKLFSRKSGQ